MKSHFYKVQANNIQMTWWKRTWLFHSTKELEVFSEYVQDMMIEWTVEDIREISFKDMEIIDHWDDTPEY